MTIFLKLFWPKQLYWQHESECGRRLHSATQEPRGPTLRAAEGHVTGTAPITVSTVRQRAHNQAS